MSTRHAMKRWLRGARAALGRIGLRLLIVNLVVLLVPVAGLEFARIYERQLLGALERDMRHQAVLVRRMVEASSPGSLLETRVYQEVLVRAAVDTRTRIQLILRDGEVRLDSHRDGPPEGPESAVPSLLPPVEVATPDAVSPAGDARASRTREPRYSASSERTRWPALADRQEVRRAFAGERASYTRVRARSPEVLLFVAEPVMRARRVMAVVYVVRSTQPVLLELYRIRQGLFWVLSVAMVFTAFVSLALGWTISRPLGRLSRAAQRIARGERDVPVPVVGSGEIRELSESFEKMTRELDVRMRYISDFAADVAHEFKSPLTSIRGAAELLGEGAADDPDARQRFLRNIELDVQRLDRLVSRLLELSRIEASVDGKTEVDLVPLTLDVARRASTPAVTVRVVRAPASLPIRMRSADVTTALLNLCDNAVRFSPPGSEVCLSVDVAVDAAQVRVCDHGPGIPEAHRARIFDRFFTTDADRAGTGLGLAIASAVAVAHGGTLTLESVTPTTGGPWGACFLLSLATRSA